MDARGKVEKAKSVAISTIIKSNLNMKHMGEMQAPFNGALSIETQQQDHSDRH